MTTRVQPVQGQSTARGRSRGGLVAGLLMLIGLVAAGLAVLLASAAAADTPCDGSAFPWVDEAEMVEYSCSFRDYVFDPGVGNRLADQQLTSSKSVSFYSGQGFAEQWLWYAPRTTITVTDDSVQWGSCENVGRRTEAGEVCTIDNDGIVVFSSVQHAFDNDNDNISNADEPGNEPVHLPALSYGGAFITTSCGNHSRPGPSGTPTPVITGLKFHDINRDGDQDANEAGLGGWEFDLVRVQSYVGQTNGPTGYATTSSAAPATLGQLRFEFTEGRHLGPGIYRLTERTQIGWTATGASFLEFEVGFGAGDSTISAGRIGNAPTEADVAKVDFAVAADFPATIDARTPTVLPIEVTLANLGPAEQVQVRDRVRVTGRHDCVFDDSDQFIDTTLNRGDLPKSFRFEFVVTCDEPSFHDFSFADDLQITTAGVTDPTLSNNTRTFTTTVPVVADTDFSAGAGLDCPDRTDVNTNTTCTVTLNVANDGFGPAEVRVDWSLTGPSDCTITPGTGSQVVNLADQASTTINQDHTVACTDRSFHPFEVTATVTPVDIHVREIEPSNDKAEAADLIEVFETADLAVVELDLWLSCDEYFNDDPFTCTAVVPVTNLGTAPQVITTTTATLTAAGCTAAPNPQSATRTIDVAQTTEITFTWSVECDDPATVHLLYLDACVTTDPADPHAEDRNPSNDCGRVAAVPIDFKPLSDPNTVNLGRNGVTSVAILSSPTFNPMLQVDTTRPITFGPTGTEATATQCATQAEDANQDGYDQDLTCKFRNEDLGLTINDNRVYLIGYLTDGTRFIGTEQVRVI